MSRADQQAKLAEQQAREEAQRRKCAEDHTGRCVPWRGAGGEIGRCIYCGKDVCKWCGDEGVRWNNGAEEVTECRKCNAISEYYRDRANSGLAALAR